MKPLVTNRISFKTADGVTFKFHLRGNVVVVRGDSGTGKSFFSKSLITFKNSDVYPSEDIEKWIDNVEVLDYSIGKNADVLQILRNQSGKLIVIDNGDILLNEEIAEYIAFDNRNQYIIFCRTDFTFHITPNYYGELKIKNNEITLHYFFSEEGWI